jgi:hypothetical protein
VRHEPANVRLEIERQPVEVLGFYSSRPRGIFTPKASDLPVEWIAPEPGAVLAVPGISVSQETNR